jgi:hypothetical protein
MIGYISYFVMTYILYRNVGRFSRARGAEGAGVAEGARGARGARARV